MLQQSIQTKTGASRINGQTILIIILLIALVATVSYIIYTKNLQSQEKKMIESYQQGYQEGVASAVVQVMQQSLTCNPVPLRYENTTISVIALDCLNLPQQTQNKTTK